MSRGCSVALCCEAWLMEFAAAPCHHYGVDASITIISTFADDPDSFESMRLDERRQRSGGWKEFPLRSQRFLDTFLMAATGSDFGVFPSAQEPLDSRKVKVKTRVISDN